MSAPPLPPDAAGDVAGHPRFAHAEPPVQPALIGAALAAAREGLLTGRAVEFPADAPRAERTIPAAWLVESARSGARIQLRRAVIAGAADFAGIRFPTDVAIESCEFTEFVDFSYAEFGRTVRLSNTSFDGGVSFDSCRFRSDAWLAQARIAAAPLTESNSIGLNVFNDAEFTGVLVATGIRTLPGAPISFERARFLSSVFMDEAVFGADVLFVSIEVKGALQLSRARFRGPVSMSQARVALGIVAPGSRFRRAAHADLQGIQVAGPFDASGAWFGGGLNLALASLEHLHIARAVFLQPLSLMGARVSGLAFLAGARFGPDAHVILESARFGDRLDLSDLGSKGRVDASDVAIEGGLTCGEGRFRQAVTFYRARIKGCAELQNASFDDGVTFQEAELGGLTLAGRVRGVFRVSNATVKGTLSLAQACFRHPAGSVDLSGTDVARLAFLDGARIHGNLRAVGLRVEQQLSCNDVVVGGDVDLYELEVRRGVFLLRSRFRGAFSMDRSRVGGEVYLSGAVLRGRATFNGSTIESLTFGPMIDSEGQPVPAALLKDDLRLSHARLGYLSLFGVRCGAPGGMAELGHVMVSGAANFTDARFESAASFYSATFKGQAIFQRVRFAGVTGSDFRGATFERTVFLSPVVFEAEADFTYASFGEQALIRGCFRSGALFEMTRFGGTADFSDPVVSPSASTGDAWGLRAEDGIPPASEFTSVSFAHATVAGDGRFDHARFDGALDLRQACFSKLFLPRPAPRRRFRLPWSRAGEPVALPRSINLGGCRYAGLSADWRSLLLRDDGTARLEPFSREAYAQVERTLRNDGDDEAANSVHLLGRRAERKHMFEWPIGSGRWWWSWFYKLAANYGIRPFRLVFLSLALLLAATLFFWQPGTMMFKDKDARRGGPYAPTLLDAAGMSLTSFLPVPISLAEELTPAPGAVNTPLGWGARRTTRQIRPTVIATLLRVMGWILVPLGLVPLSSFLRRSAGR